MMYWYGQQMLGWGPALIVMGIAVALLVVAVVAWFVRRSATSPQQVLADRYARGELDEDQYRHMLAVMRGERRVDPR